MFGLDVVVDVAIVGLVGRGTHLDFCHVLKPLIHPRTDRVFSALGEVYLSGFYQCFLKFLFDFRLGFAQHILDNLLSGDGIVARGEAAFPATVLAFSDIPLAVCSFLSHSRHLLSSSQHYHRRDEIAIHQIQQLFAFYIDCSYSSSVW